MTSKVIDATGTIESLDDLLGAVWRIRKIKDYDSNLNSLIRIEDEKQFINKLEKSPYSKRGKSLGLWFRGQSNSTYPLAPGAFRPKQIGDQEENIFYEETSASFHFMLRRPEYRSQCASDFEWLALLQHYGGFTRLLDWSENALVAIFFAVEGNSNDQVPGSLYVLNAAALNEQSCVIAYDIPQEQTEVVSEESRLGVCIDTSPDVIFRSAQAFSRTSREWRSRVESVLHFGLRAELRWITAALSLLDEFSTNSSAIKSPELTEKRFKLAQKFYEKLTYPIAVFPHRSNSRLIAQVGTFTLHGGKGKFEQMFEEKNHNDLIRRPVSLESLARKSSHKEWLLRYEVPFESKKTIRAQLQAIGLNRATLFPEIQSDGEIIKELWCQ